jgi:hypothetical protein
MSTKDPHDHPPPDPGPRPPKAGGPGASGEPPYTRLLAHSMRTAFKATRHHAVLSGNMLEVYEYEKPVFYDFMEPQQRKVQATEKTEEEKQENRDRSRGRSRKRITRLVHSNFGYWFDQRGSPYLSKFLTLTFGDDAYDIKEMNRRFTLFIKRLNYVLFKSKTAIVQYLAIIEIQPKSKKVHYHVVLFNLPFIPRNIDVLNETWGHGYIWIEKIDNEQHAAQYITKYMTKEDDERLRGEKSYFCSRGLKKPVVILDEEIIYQLRPLITHKPIYKNEFENEHNGQTRYYRFDITGQDELKNFINLHGRKST